MMRLMFARESANSNNPLFLPEAEAIQREASGELRSATEEEVAGISSLLSRLLVERTSPSVKIGQAVEEVRLELLSATKLFGPFHSAHEALGVIDEELHELRLEIYKKAKYRDVAAMRTEACQLAAMATRVMVDLC